MSLRSSAVSWGKVLASMSLSAKAGVCAPRPSLFSQVVTFSVMTCLASSNSLHKPTTRRACLLRLPVPSCQKWLWRLRIFAGSPNGYPDAQNWRSYGNVSYDPASRELTKGLVNQLCVLRRTLRSPIDSGHSMMGAPNDWGRRGYFGSHAFLQWGQRTCLE